MLSIWEFIHIPFSCSCEKGKKPGRGEDWTSEDIDHFTPSSLICHEVGFNVLNYLIDCSVSVHIYKYSLYFLQFHCL